MTHRHATVCKFFQTQIVLACLIALHSNYKLSDHRCKFYLNIDSCSVKLSLSSIPGMPVKYHMQAPLLLLRLTKCVRRWSAAGAGHPCWPWVCGRGAGSCVGTLWEMWRVWEAPAPDAYAPWRYGCRALGLERSAHLMTSWWMWSVWWSCYCLFVVLCDSFFRVKLCHAGWFLVHWNKLSSSSARFLSLSGTEAILCVCSECYWHTKRRLRQRSRTCFLREKRTTLLSLYSVNTTSLLQPLFTAFSV